MNRRPRATCGIGANLRTERSPASSPRPEGASPSPTLLHRSPPTQKGAQLGEHFFRDLEGEGLDEMATMQAQPSRPSGVASSMTGRSCKFSRRWDVHDEELSGHRSEPLGCPEDASVRGRGSGDPLVKGLSALMSASILLVLGLTSSGCTRYVTADRLPQAYYQTAPPLRDVSKILEESFLAVKRIRVTGIYDHYRFSPASAPLEGDRLSPEVLARAVDTFETSTSKAASAVQIAQAGLKVTLLTCQHAIQFPDTVLEYSDTSGTGLPEGPRAIHRVSIKRSQYNLVADRTFLFPFEVLAEDAQADLAFIGTVYPLNAQHRALATLPARMGDSDRLSWGSFVYVLGHPGGYPMVTRGIVSDPGRSSLSSFLIDGLWNEGMSGGPILAIRGDDGALEWVGIARAAAGRVEYRLAPDPEMVPSQDERLLYEGRIYLEEVQRVLYGISLSVPMTEIRGFMNRNRAELRSRGWALPTF